MIDGDQPPLRLPVARLALGAVFVLLLFHAAYSGVDHDEVEHLHAAWLVSQGLKPFQDFFECHHPVLFYLLAPWAHALEGFPRALIFATRALNLGLLGLLLAAFTSLVRPLLHSRSVAWAPLLLLGCFFFARNMMEVRPDPWMTTLCTLGFWQWAGYLRGGRLRHAAVAGLLLGLGIGFLQKAVVFVALMFLGTVISLRDRTAFARAARGAALLVAFALVPLVVLAMFVWRAGYWSDFVFWNYRFNQVHHLQAPLRGPSAFALIGTSIGEDPLLWVAGLVGLFLAIPAIGRRVEPELSIAAVVVIGFTTALFFVHWPFSHNLLLMQPSLGILAASALDSIEAPRWRSAAGALLLLLLAKVAVLCFFYTENAGSTAIQKRLLASTRPSDVVAVPPPYHPIFRPDAFFFWALPGSASATYLECCRRYWCPLGKVDQDRRAWQERPPRFVYVPDGEPTWAPDEFSAHQSAYRPTELPGLWELAASK